MSALVITDACTDGVRIDVRVDGGLITEMTTSVKRRVDDRRLDAGGACLLVGLHDHHLHLRAAAAAASSLVVGPPAVTDRAGLISALQASASALPPGAWLRAVGYHESIAGLLDRAMVDAWVPDRPVRVQHRSGALWMLNSAALERLGVETGRGDSNGSPPTPPPPLRPLQGVGAGTGEGAGIEHDAGGRPTGRLWRMDAWLGDRLRAEAGADGSAASAAVQSAELARQSAHAAARGVTGWTDATPGRTDEEVASLAAMSQQRIVVQRLHLMVRADQPAGRPAALADAPLVTTGPVKVILDDDQLPLLEELTATIRYAHGRGHPVAVHCVTAVQLVLTLTAFGAAGVAAGDRIEHGAVIPADLIGALAASTLTVVTQPGLVAERGDTYRAEVPLSEHADLWRAASLVRAGVRVSAGSDAPHGPPDPWRSIDAATQRRTPSGCVLGAAERVDAGTARGWWSGWADRPDRPRRVTVGAPGDLILVTPGPRPEVVATVVAGRIVYKA